MGKPGLRKVHRYSVDFKLTAVKLSHMPGVEVQTVANALDIHPFMLSRWRKEVRDGVLKGRARRVDLPSRSAREIKQLQALRREHAMLKEEHELLKKPSGSLPNEGGGLRVHPQPARSLQAQADMYGLRRDALRVLRVAAPSRKPSPATGPELARRDPRALFEQSRGTYGSPRIHRALVASGLRVSRRRVERLMRQAGLRARVAKLYRRIPGLHGFFMSIPNRQLDRLAPGPDQVWVGDITYLKVAGTWRYLAVVMDRYSRRIIGWSLGAAKDARLTLAALNRAVFHRRPRPGVIFHSDRGVEYAAYAFRNRLATLGFVQSMNRPREITDNAHMESFFHSMKNEAVHGVTFATDADLVSRAPQLHPLLQRRATALRDRLLFTKRL